MDIVHHAAIGAIGFAALASQDQELAGLGFLCGSVLPDLDVAFMAGGKRLFLRQHQGPTHSLLLAPVYAAGLAALIALQAGWQWPLYLGLLAGLAAHVLLDLFNTFGIQIGWPATSRRICLDAVFFIDAVAWALTLSALALLVFRLGDPVVIAGGYGSLYAAYFAGRLFLQRGARARTGADFAIPSAWHPFRFYLFSRRAGRLETGVFDALAGRVRASGSLAEPPPEALALARRSALFRDMQAILRGLQITRVEHDASGTVVLAQDLAVRNFGGKFGRTELRFDSQGKLLHEMAHI